MSVYALNTLVSYLYNMKLFNVKEEILNETKNYFISVYNLDEKIVNENINVFMKEYDIENKENKINSIEVDDSKLERMNRD